MGEKENSVHNKTELVLAAILELTAKEQFYINKRLAEYQRSPEECYQKIKKLPLFFIVKFSHHNRAFRMLCQEESLTSHWLKFLPVGQELKGSLFNTITGFYLLSHLHQQFLRELPIRDLELKMVDALLAAYHDDALVSQKRIFLQISVLRGHLRNQVITYPELLNYVTFGLDVAKKLGTPGYFETAILFLEIGCYALAKLSEEQKILGKTAYQMCFQHLFLAQFLQHTEMSQRLTADIYGGDFFKCNEYRFTYGHFTSFFKLRQTIQNYYKISQVLIDIAQKKAEIIAQQEHNVLIKDEFPSPRASF